MNSRIIELYREGGISEVFRGAKDYIMHLECFDPYFRTHYHNQRQDNKERWNIISKNISECNSLIDIGCAEGYFTRKAAHEGILSLGIDTNKYRINETNSVEGSAFMNLNLSPENITDLPEVDLVLFLTVYHHWVDDYGSKESEYMLDVLLNKCQVLIFEPPGDRIHGGDASPEDALKWYTDLVESHGGEVVSSQFVNYMGGDRKDPFLVVET